MPGGNVGVRRDSDGRVGFAGLSTCGRVWLCPMCNAKIMAQRAIEIGALLAWATAQGFFVVWGSLTTHHTRETLLRKPRWMPADSYDVDPGPLFARWELQDDRYTSKYRSHLDPAWGLLDVQTKAWAYAASGREWQGLQAIDYVEADGHPEGCPSDCTTLHRVPVDSGRDGIIGILRAAELTVGGNGWHPHFHPIVLVRGSRALAQRVADTIVRRWVAGVRRTGHRADLDNGAQQMKVLAPERAHDELASYVTKSTYRPDRLGFEAAWSQGKATWNKHGKGRAAATLSHWSLLAEVESGDMEHVALWWHLEEATKGHRALTWSRGVRELAGLGNESTDEDIAAREIGTVEDTVCVITAEGWRAVRDHPGMLALILDTLADGGFTALRLVLDAYGIEHLTIDELASV